MPSSPIRKLTPLADKAKQKGIKVYHLNIGQPDLATPKVALDTLKSIDRSVLEYSPSQGFLSLRKKMVSYYKKFNINVEADDIIITTGGSEAVNFAFMSARLRARQSRECCQRSVAKHSGRPRSSPGSRRAPYHASRPSCQSKATRCC